MPGKDLLSVSDLTAEDIWRLIARARDMKREGPNRLLEAKVLALIFEKPSLRTRVSFDVAMRQLGGHAIYLSPGEVGLGQREPVSDVARVLSRYVDGIVARTFSHDVMESLARHATVPVINGLTDREHPCQALSDFLTIYERKGRLEGLTLAFVGDGNNVARSLLLAASIMGTDFRIASPQGYEVGGELLALGRRFARQSGAQLLLTAEPRRAVHGADVVYTDVWASMGQEAEAEARRLAFADYQLTRDLLAMAAKDALLMHPLPAHHGEEIAPGLLDEGQSVVFDQAENRLHLQKALLVELMGKVGPSP